MTDATIQRVNRPLIAEGLFERGLAALIGVALLLKLHLVFVTNVNWDEFYYLHWVYAYLRGTLTVPLQTFHVHFFTWLRHVSGNEVDQIIAARLVIYGLGLVSLLLLYAIGRRFLDRAATLFALLCFLAVSYVVEHGTSFRADPIAAFLCLVAVYCLLRGCESVSAGASAGVAIAAALMITIKTAFYLPILGLILLMALLRHRGRGRASIVFLAFGAAFAGALAAFFLLHRGLLAAPALEEAEAIVTGSASKVIRLDVLLPAWPYLLHSLIEDSVIWACLALGAMLTLAAALRGGAADQDRALHLLIFLLPLTSFVFYRNAFPYFYAFILPSAVLVCGVLFAALMRLEPGRLLRAPRLLALGLVAAVSVSFAKHYVTNAADRTELQRETVALAHRLFPEPVAYIDRCSMISSYPKVGLFMSTWGMEQYRQGGRPIFRDLLIRQRPRFLLANIVSLDLSMAQERLRDAGVYTLLEEDFETLRANFVHHWGQLYVAGKTLRFSSSPEDGRFEILIPGSYTLEAAGTVLIDGRPVAAGSTLHLAAGMHRAEPLSPALRFATLRWGDHLYRPPQAPPEGPLFVGF